MFVLRCVNLYIRAGGFTYDIALAKRYSTRKDAEKDQVYGWVIEVVP